MIRSIESLKHVQHVNKHITDITTRPHILKVYISCHCTKSPLQIIRWKCEHPTGKSFIVKVTKVNSTAISLYWMVGNHTWRLSFGAPEGHIRNQYSCRYTVQIEKVHVHRRFNRDRLPKIPPTRCVAHHLSLATWDYKITWLRVDQWWML